MADSIKRQPGEDGNYYTTYQLRSVHSASHRSGHSNDAAATAAAAASPHYDAKASSESSSSSSTPSASDPDFNDILETSLEQERQNAWEQVKSYAILLFAAAHLKSIEQDTSFFFLLAVFTALFTITSYVKAYFVGMSMHAAKRGVSDMNRPLLSTYSLINSFLLAFITFLLVQTVMSRATPFLTEGHWSLENLVLPLVLGVVLYSEWYSRMSRTSQESVDVHVSAEKVQ